MTDDEQAEIESLVELFGLIEPEIVDGDFYKIMAKLREPRRGEWVSNNELARITGFSSRTIAGWARSPREGSDRHEPSWRDAVHALRQAGFRIILAREP